MTTTPQEHATEGANTQPSTLQLPFDPRELLSVRILPSEFARICGVSRQTVSVWIRDGKISPGIDGKIDPQRAFRQVLRASNLGRVRARLLRAAIDDLGELRARSAQAAVLEQKVSDLTEQIGMAQ